MATKPWLLGGAVVAAVAVARPVHAADWLTLLDWACDPKPANTAAVKRMMLSACAATEGAKAACDVVSGTPFACYGKEAVARDNSNCDKASLTFEITTTTAQTFGWKIVGTLDVSATYALFWKTAQECALTLKTPVPTESGGDYVFRAGQTKAIAIMEASGTGRITFLGGTVFSEAVTKQCLGEQVANAFRKETANACKGQPPTPSPSPSPSPGAPSPTPTGSATPTPMPTAPGPTPTASATPGPSPMPTAPGPSPSPTASATPGPSPMPTAPGPSPTAGERLR